MGLKRTPLGRGNSELKRSELKSTSTLTGGGFKSTSQLTKTIKKLKRFSGKRADIEKDYRKIQPVVWERDGGRCRGCGTTQRLSYSHLIPRSYREDLIAEKDNIHLHCMDDYDEDGCHTKHDNQEWDDMLDGDVIQETMKRLDLNYYNKITV